MQEGLIIIIDTIIDIMVVAIGGTGTIQDIDLTTIVITGNAEGSKENQNEFGIHPNRLR